MEDGGEETYEGEAGEAGESRTWSMGIEKLA